MGYLALFVGCDERFGMFEAGIGREQCAELGVSPCHFDVDGVGVLSIARDLGSDIFALSLTRPQ